MTTRSQKRKAVEELVSTEMETPIAEVNQNLNPVAGSSKSPRIITENLEEIKSSLRKEIMSDLTKILAKNQKEMLKLIAAPVKKQIAIATAEETDSESENIPENATSTPIKSKTTATNHKITPVNSRNMYQMKGPLKGFPKLVIYHSCRFQRRRNLPSNVQTHYRKLTKERL